MKKQYSAFVVFSALALMVGCSTSGGKQESVFNHEAASRDLKGTVSELSDRTQKVFKDMGITLTDTQSKEMGKEQDLSGRVEDKNVSVQMTDLGQNMTHVEIIAKTGALQWNEDYANRVLSNLIAKS
jgi:hypothetical protein